MKTFILFALLLGSLPAMACTDVDADDLVLDRTKMMAKRYHATKIGIGASIILGNIRITNISIMNGDGGNDGVRVDRIGSILINMDNCVVTGKLISMIDETEL